MFLDFRSKSDITTKAKEQEGSVAAAPPNFRRGHVFELYFDAIVSLFMYVHNLHKSSPNAEYQFK